MSTEAGIPDDDAPEWTPREGSLPNAVMAEGPSGRRKYDWLNIKRVYVEGYTNGQGGQVWPSMTETAELLDVPRNRLSERASAEHWKVERSAYQAHLEAVKQRKRLDALAQDAVDVDSNALRAAKLGMQLGVQRLGEIAKEVQRKAKDESERAAAGLEPDAFAQPAVNAGELGSLASAVGQWHAIARKALGEVETVRTEITGAGGGPIESSMDITAELMRDDPDRLAGIFIAMERADLLPPGTIRQIEAAASEPEE